MGEHSSGTVTKKRSLTGPVTIAVIICFGLVMLLLLKRAPSSSDPAPADAKFRVPVRTIRVLSIDLSERDADRAILEIKSVQPDIVVLQGVRTADVERIGRAIGMSHADATAGDVFYPSQNFQGPDTSFGNAIFSRFPLYEGRSIPNRGGSFGVWAVAVIDGAKIMVASVNPTDAKSQVLGAQDADSVRNKELSMLARAYEELGRPPMLLAGEVRQLMPDQQKTMAKLGDWFTRQDDQVFLACDRSSTWNCQRIDLPADVPGICVDARGH